MVNKYYKTPNPTKQKQADTKKVVKSTVNPKNTLTASKQKELQKKGTDMALGASGGISGKINKTIAKSTVSKAERLGGYLVATANKAKHPPAGRTKLVKMDKNAIVNSKTKSGGRIYNEDNIPDFIGDSTLKPIKTIKPTRKTKETPVYHQDENIHMPKNKSLRLKDVKPKTSAWSKLTNAQRRAKEKQKKLDDIFPL